MAAWSHHQGSVIEAASRSLVGSISALVER